VLVGGGVLVASLSAPAITHERAVSAERTPRQPLRSFKPGEVWLDTSGKPIQAHAASIIEVDGKYYWYGENKEFSTGKTDIWTWGVRCYASTDLYNWDDCGLIIPPNTNDRSSPLHPAAGLDRPHILYNASTKKFVCWLKILLGSQQTQTVLAADNFIGPYKIIRTGMRPLDMGAGDFDLCVSQGDGKAYMYFERVHSELICADLTEDYTNVTGYYSTHFPHTGPPVVREGPAYFRRGAKHYLLTSGTTGKFPNPSEIAMADTFHGPFTVLGDLHSSDRSRTSFNSQISCVFKHPKKKDLYIAVADRWMGPQSGPEFENGETSRLVQNAFSKYWSSPRQRLTPQENAILQRERDLNPSLSRYVWLPIRFDGDRPFITWRAEWSTDEFNDELI
jgi:hypothetical protein